MHTRLRSFGWIDLSVTGLTFALFGIALMGSIMHTREVDNRVRCARNLLRIGQAMQMYATNEVRNGQSFPRTKFDLDHADRVRAFTNWKQPHSFDEGAPEANDVTAALYLLVKAQDVDPSVLVCPGSNKKQLIFKNSPAPQAGQAKAKPLADAPKALSNFPGMEYMSYSMQNPYPSKNAIGSGFKWNVTLDHNFALVADLNPGGKAVFAARRDWPAKQLRDANSPNHLREGQNILYGDGHVEFQTTPFAGALRTEGAMTYNDNIYAPLDADPQKQTSVMRPPVDNADNVLLPPADYRP
jgi:prepilin-type processing-associated H-X9-DG protein